MKLRLLSICTILLVIIFSIGLSNCGDNEPWVDPTRPVTNLLSLTIQPIDFDASNKPINRPDVTALTVEKIPEPINEDEWDDVFFNLTEADSEELWFLLEEHTETARIIAQVSPGCTVQWGIGTSGTRPARFSNPGEPLPFGKDDFIYIRVATRDEQYRHYYRIYARMASPVTLLELVTVSGRETRLRYDSGFDNIEKFWDDADFMPISIAVNEATMADILTTKMDDNSSVSFAVIRNYTGGDPMATLTFPYEMDNIIYLFDPEVEADVPHYAAKVPLQDNDILVARVTAQNTLDKNYYKFRVHVGRIANISTLKLVTPSQSFEILSMGIPNEEWEEVLSGSFGTADQPVAGFSIEIELEDEVATFEFVQIDDKDVPLPVFDGIPGGSMWFPNKSELAIKVESATKISGAPAITLYYKIRVDLLAAVILQQPKSAVYYIESHTYPTVEVLYEFQDTTQPGNPTVTITNNRILIDAVGTRTLDRAIEPLEAKLDRPLVGATYQWYTANSWYGGYGFDKEGRIRGDDGFIQDLYHPATGRGGLDEKNNVSFHNGGNQFYRLPIGYPLDNPLYPGTPIPGATGATYIPTIDARNRPFIAGYSNQSQYYWVVITDTNGYQVQSERAVIIAEWGEVFDMGEPLGIKVNKKHHIVDLNNDLGMPKRNVVPFTFHRQQYVIPLTLPADFDIADYTMAVCQAIFYLRDGRTWIQNWTQGDVYFNVDGVRIVGYYNLTNNNATLGLSGDSRDPQGASLWQTPTDIVIAPAGEKPPNLLPPFNSDGITPTPTGDAQGWFTAFIEIVELRFEGPARER
jgi:hypothetical protein